MMNFEKWGRVQLAWGLFLLMGVGLSLAREIPVPLPEHPGNVCLEGERLSVALTTAEINGLMLGINAQRNSRVRLTIGNVRWVRL